MKHLADDQRTRLTKGLIRRAFTSLLEEKPIQRVAVTELCQRAGINRSTFYAHYDDVYDLRRQIEDDILGEFQKAFSPLLGDGEAALSPLETTTWFYRFLRENADVYPIALGENGDKDFVLRLLSLGREGCLRGYSRQFPGATPRQLEYFYAFASNGHIGLLRQWMEEGMVTPAEEMARMAENIMLRGMEFLQGKI